MNRPQRSDGRSVDRRIPAYLGRVLRFDRVAVGTCFQVSDGVLVTALHVLDEIDDVYVEPLNGDGGLRAARVVRTDLAHDLAVLETDRSFPESVTGWVATDDMRVSEAVVVTGMSLVFDPGRETRYLDAPGRWSGGTTRNAGVRLGRLTSTDVVLGMSGAPVRLPGSDQVVGVVSARYNTPDCWLGHTVWVTRSENLRSLLASRVDVKFARHHGSPTRHRIVAAVVGMTILAATSVVAIQVLDSPTPQSGPPVLVVDATPTRGSLADDFALPSVLELSDTELATLNQEIRPNSERFSTWYTDHDAVPVGHGVATFTLKGNDTGPVRITRMTAVKQCGQPLNGTLFVGFRQGAPEPTVQLGINLDAPDPVTQELYTTVDGPFPAGPDYFHGKTVALNPGETQTFTIGGFTKSYGCTFTVRVSVVASSGTAHLDIGAGDAPFKVTARATGSYGARYEPEPVSLSGWQRADP